MVAKFFINCALNKSPCSSEFLWWVFDEYDQTEFNGLQLKIVCSDQSFFIKYGLQQFDDKRRLVIALRDYKKLVHLSSPPKFEDTKGVITNFGIKQLLNWCKKSNHNIEYSLDNGNNQLNKEQQNNLLTELQSKINITHR